ncbi:GNAT family N-acetyltransferase [uncultured Brevundimonas sp.]|uniref:GNAT family N-acetyltransferase n=1 Tax=uncultured Brevundimonas sp. TaxID=213418 RepID=UPI0026065029|nr:GNAT family N-acetyltransferase [uncultured Brevundimonas sp.]
MIPEEYRLGAETPSDEEYLRLRVAAGLSRKSPEGAAKGLANSWHSVVVRRDGDAVGMGRVIGDGGLFFMVVDIAVEPAHQGRGLGKAIMAALVERLREAAPSRAHVALIADGEAHRLYAQYGFTLTAPGGVGMQMVIP